MSNKRIVSAKKTAFKKTIRVKGKSAIIIHYPRRRRTPEPEEQKSPAPYNPGKQYGKKT